MALINSASLRRCVICGAARCSCGSPTVCAPVDAWNIPVDDTGDEEEMALQHTVYVAEKRLYLDKDQKVVEANDPSRVELLCAVGAKLSLADAQKYGLVKGQANAKAEAPAGDAPAGDGDGEPKDETKKSGRRNAKANAGADKPAENQ